MENIDTFFKKSFNEINVENVNELYPENDLRELLIHIYKNIFGNIIENETKYMTSNSSMENYIKLEFERNENLTKEVINKLNKRLNAVGNISILERVAIIANTFFLHQIFNDGNNRTMFILIKVLLAKEGLNFTPNIEEINIRDIFGIAYFDDEIPTDDIINFIKNNTNNLKKEIN